MTYRNPVVFEFRYWVLVSWELLWLRHGTVRQPRERGTLAVGGRYERTDGDTADLEDKTLATVNCQFCSFENWYCCMQLGLKESNKCGYLSKLRLQSIATWKYYKHSSFIQLRPKQTSFYLIPTSPFFVTLCALRGCVFIAECHHVVTSVPPYREGDRLKSGFHECL